MFFANSVKLKKKKKHHTVNLCMVYLQAEMKIKITSHINTIPYTIEQSW